MVMQHMDVQLRLLMMAVLLVVTACVLVCDVGVLRLCSIDRNSSPRLNSWRVLKRWFSKVLNLLWHSLWIRNLPWQLARLEHMW